MRRIFVQIIITVLFLFTPIGTAHAVVLKDVDAPQGVPRTGAVIVAVSTYVGEWESQKLGPLVLVDDAYARRFAEQLAAKPGVHYVDLVVGTEATGSGIVAALTKAAGEKLDFLVFSYRGFGLGADTHASCFAAADWDHANPDATCLRDTKVAPLITAAAPRRLVLLDASSPSMEITAAVDADTYGPTADDWPVKDDPNTAVMSSGRSEKYVACNGFTSMVSAVIAEGSTESSLTFGDLTSGIAAIASTPPGTPLPRGVSACSPPIVPSVDSTWFSDAVLIPEVHVARPPDPTIVQPSVAPLPTTPVVRKSKPLRGPTVASLVTTGVCAVVGVGSYVAGENRLAEYNDPDWAQAHYPGDDKGRAEAANAELPTYGALAIAGFSCAGVGAAASGLTWYFGE